MPPASAVLFTRGCAACLEAFVITAGQAKWFAERGMRLPRRCAACVKDIKQHGKAITSFLPYEPARGGAAASDAASTASPRLATEALTEERTTADLSVDASSVTATSIHEEQQHSDVAAPAAERRCRFCLEALDSGVASLREHVDSGACRAARVAARYSHGATRDAEGEAARTAAAQAQRAREKARSIARGKAHGKRRHCRPVAPY